jgi:transposase InsO family protein
VPRVLAELRAQGYDVGRKRVARLMAAAGLRGRRPPRWARTTTPEPTPTIPDRVHGQFAAAASDVLWVGDITYVRTWEGWLYLATVLDVFSRRVIGWALTDHLRASLVCDALRMAVVTRGGSVAGVIFHSDRGSRYTAAEFRDLCHAHGVLQSMGRTGVCWDQRPGRVVLRHLQA